MTTLVTYIGGHDAVDLPDIGVENLTRGDSIPVDDAYAERLLEQPDNWTAADTITFEATPADPDDDEEK